MKKKRKTRNLINVFNSQKRHPVSVAAIHRFASRAARLAGVQQREFTVKFVSARLMNGLNLKFRGKDYPTDVLSFYGWDQEELPAYLGDIVICPEVAAENSRRLSRELKSLVLHGLLHLIGYDHETDHGEMNRLEAKFARSLGLQ
ncbi:MAG TPA: rRNA maturation RNase YbeY [Acidobacteriota bacterium]